MSYTEAKRRVNAARDRAWDSAWTLLDYYGRPAKVATMLTAQAEDMEKPAKGPRVMTDEERKISARGNRWAAKAMMKL